MKFQNLNLKFKLLKSNFIAECEVFQAKTITIAMFCHPVTIYLVKWDLRTIECTSTTPSDITRKWA